jgi:hypothetical protein
VETGSPYCRMQNRRGVGTRGTLARFPQLAEAALRPEHGSHGPRRSLPVATRRPYADAVPWSGVAGADRHRDVRRGPA